MTKTVPRETIRAILSEYPNERVDELSANYGVDFFGIPSRIASPHLEVLEFDPTKLHALVSEPGLSQVWVFPDTIVKHRNLYCIVTAWCTDRIASLTASGKERDAIPFIAALKGLEQCAENVVPDLEKALAKERAKADDILRDARAYAERMARWEEERIRKLDQMLNEARQSLREWDEGWMDDMYESNMRRDGAIAELLGDPAPATERDITVTPRYEANNPPCQNPRPREDAGGQTIHPEDARDRKTTNTPEPKTPEPKTPEPKTPEPKTPEPKTPISKRFSKLEFD